MAPAVVCGVPSGSLLVFPHPAIHSSDPVMEKGLTSVQIFSMGLFNDSHLIVWIVSGFWQYSVLDTLLCHIHAWTLSSNIWIKAEMSRNMQRPSR